MESLIGIDVGSSSIKGAVLDLDRLTVGATARAPFPDAVAGLPPGRFEIEPAEVVRRVRQVLSELLPAAPGCAGILFSSQMGGVVLVDERGNPLTNYLSWRDQRVLGPHPSARSSYFERLHDLVTDREQQELGRELKPGSATSLLFWLAERGELPASPASPLSLADFVLMRLCDGPPATERTMALGTLNLATRDWHRGVFEKLGLARLRWPVLVEAASPVGQFEYGGRRIPCYPALGDQQCALAGALLQEGELSLNISTGSQVSRILPTWRPGDYQTRPYFDGRLLDTITHLPAGRSLNVLVDLLTELASAQGQALADPWPYIARVAAEAADTDLTVDLAFFAGPLGERGGIGNITVDNLTIGTLFRSALRSMAANYETCAARLFPVRDWQRIVLSGGLPQRVDVLRAFIGERLPGPQRMSAAAEETLTGLLVVGLVAMGRARSVAESSAMMG